MGDPMETDLLQGREPTIFNSKLILFFVGITLFIALLYRQNDLSLLALLVLLVMAGSKIWSALSLSRVTCETEAQQQRVFAGESIVLATTVANKKFLPVWIRLEWPARNLAMVADGKARDAVQEAGILWHQQACFQQRLTALRRGVYTAGPSSMQTSDLFGFFRTSKNLPQTNTIIVYPKLVAVKELDLPRHDLFGKPGSRHPINDPVYTTGTRDYQAASPARHIHWKASARHARLQEKVFEPSQQGKIMVVLDVDGFAEKRLEDAFERTLEIIAALCLQIEDAGMALGFATNGTTLGGEFSLTPTGQGPQQVSVVLEALARLQMRSSASLIEIIQQAVVPVHGISCLCFAYENALELEQTRLLCRQKHIPLMLFVHQVHGSFPPSEERDHTEADVDSNPPRINTGSFAKADENTFASDVLQIKDLLARQEEPK